MNTVFTSELYHDLMVFPKYLYLLAFSLKKFSIRNPII